MLMLDENLPAGQRLLLRNWRIRFWLVGEEIAFAGAKDENLIPVLHRLSKPTFFSLDQDFYGPRLAHRRYCLVWLDVRGRQAAEFVRRFLWQPAFDSQRPSNSKLFRRKRAGSLGEKLIGDVTAGERVPSGI